MFWMENDNKFKIRMPISHSLFFLFASFKKKKMKMSMGGGEE